MNVLGRHAQKAGLNPKISKYGDLFYYLEEEEGTPELLGV